MSNRTAVQLSQVKVARITGALYLGFILASVFADLFGHIGIGEALQIYQTIITDLYSFRLGLVFAFISALLFLMSAWGLYVILRLVNKDLALLFLLLNTVGVGIQCASMLPLVSALLLGNGLGSLQGYSADQIEGLMLVSINSYKTGFVTAQLFFGTWLFPLGYLIYKSGFLPRFLGVLILLDGVGILVWFLQAFLLPAYPAIIYPGLLVSFIAEVGLGLWLLLKGIRFDTTTSTGEGLES